MIECCRIVLDSDDSRISQHHVRADPEGLKATRHVAFHSLHEGQVAASARLWIGNMGGFVKSRNRWSRDDVTNDRALRSLDVGALASHLRSLRGRSASVAVLRTRLIREDGEWGVRDVAIPGFPAQEHGESKSNLKEKPVRCRCRRFLGNMTNYSWLLCNRPAA